MTPYIKKGLDALGIEFDQELYNKAVAVAEEKMKHLPWSCLSRVLLRNPVYPAYPGLSGTGFFCRTQENPSSIFFVTARHCITSNLDSKVEQDEILKLLAVPVCSDGSSDHDNSNVVFDMVGQIRHDCDEIKPGKFEDTLIFRVSENMTPRQKNTLYNRALELPRPGVVKYLIDTKQIEKTYVIGCPLSGSDNSSITYQEDESVDIFFPNEFFIGAFYENASYPDRYSIELVRYDDDVNDFSGSPVLWGHLNNGFISYLPLGMVLTGNRYRAEFLCGELIVNKIHEMAGINPVLTTE